MDILLGIRRALRQRGLICPGYMCLKECITSEESDHMIWAGIARDVDRRTLDVRVRYACPYRV